MPMTEERKQFNKFRRNFKKEHDWPGVICARCGHFVRGGRFGRTGHLHHLTPLRKGGMNDVENLIPLCHVCHEDIEELTQLNVTVEEFLKIPTTVDLLIANRYRLDCPDMSFEDVVILTRKIGREMETVKYEGKRQEDWPEYDELWAAEKEVFPLLAKVEW